MLAKNGRAAAFGAAYGVSRALYAGLRHLAPGRQETWRRTNAAGRSVDLYSGPAVALGAALASAVAGQRPAALAVLGAAAGGAVESRAFGLLGVGAASLAAAAMMKERTTDRLLAAVVIAGAAHCVNLVDLRPGRAVLTTAAFATPGVLRRGPGAAFATVPLGAAAAIAADDLGERSTLGEAGAYALGAALGAAVVAGNGRVGLAAHALGVAAGTAYGEWVALHPRG
jgi:hypothetical protein